MSQRLPSFSALHMLPVLPTIEFVTGLVVPPTSVELVTLEELFELIELLTLVDLLELTELELLTEFVTVEDVLESTLLAAATPMLSAGPHPHSPSAITVMRYRHLIVQCSCRVPIRGSSTLTANGMMPFWIEVKAPLRSSFHAHYMLRCAVMRPTDARC
jgi:hypothetical protein